MVNVVAALKPLVHRVVKLAGLSPQAVEIEPGTVMNFWAPKATKLKNQTPTPNTKLPGKPVVVLVHPFVGYGILTWLPQVLALTSQYSVYVPDLIFFGASTTSRPDRSTVFQAECMARGLRKLGVEKCTVVGLSYGGMVGFKMAAMYPDLVEALVASSAVTELTESISNQSLMKNGALRWSDFLLPETVEGVKFLLTVGTHKWPWLPDFIYKDCLKVLFNNKKQKAELLEALVVKDEESTNIINYPQRIHLLWGDDDKIFNLDFARSMKERLGKNATLQSIKNAGHLAHLERPFTYNKHLKKFLSSTTNSK